MGDKGSSRREVSLFFELIALPGIHLPGGPLVHFLRMEESHVVVGRDRATKLRVSERLRGPPEAPPSTPVLLATQ